LARRLRAVTEPLAAGRTVQPKGGDAMNASTIKLTALRRSGLAAVLVSVALLAVSAPNLALENAATSSTCQSTACGG
jgi:hypothetical protein